MRPELGSAADPAVDAPHSALAARAYRGARRAVERARDHDRQADSNLNVRTTLLTSALALGMLALATDAVARYKPPAFHDLAGASDLIVVGTIVRLSDSTFTLQIEEVLAGTWPDARVTALRHVDWTCSRRWRPYEVGQREIAFLRRLAVGAAGSSEAPFRTMSPGDEGEWEIRDGRVSVQGFRIPGGEVFNDGEHPGQWVSSDLVRDALRTYRQLYVFTPSPGGRYEIGRRVSGAAFAEFSARSFVHRYLVATTEDARAPREVTR